MEIIEVEENIASSRLYCKDISKDIDPEHLKEDGVRLLHDSLIISDNLICSLSLYETQFMDAIPLIEFRDKNGNIIATSEDVIVNIMNNISDNYFSNSGHYDGIHVISKCSLNKIIDAADNTYIVATVPMRGRTDNGIYDPTILYFYKVEKDGWHVSYEKYKITGQLTNDRYNDNKKYQGIFHPIAINDNIFYLDEFLLYNISTETSYFIFQDVNEEDFIQTIYNDLLTIIPEEAILEPFGPCENHDYYYSKFIAYEDQKIYINMWGATIVADYSLQNLLIKYGFELIKQYEDNVNISTIDFDPNKLVVYFLPISVTYDVNTQNISYEIIKKRIPFDYYNRVMQQAICDLNNEYIIKSEAMEEPQNYSDGDWFLNGNLIQSYMLKISDGTSKRINLNNLKITGFPYVEVALKNFIKDNFPDMEWYQPEIEHLLYAFPITEKIDRQFMRSNIPENNTTLIPCLIAFGYVDRFNPEIEFLLLASAVIDTETLEVQKIFDIQIEMEEYLISIMNADKYSYSFITGSVGELRKNAECIDDNPRGPKPLVIYESGNLRYRNKLLCHPDTILETMKTTHWSHEKIEYGPNKIVNTVDCGKLSNSSRTVKKEDVFKFMVQ